MSSTNSQANFFGEQAFVNFMQYYRSLPDNEKEPRFSSDLLVMWQLKTGQKKPGMFDKAVGVGTFMVWQNYIILLAWRDPNIPEKSFGDKAKQFGKELVFQLASEALSELTKGFSEIITKRLESSVKGVDPNTIALKQKNMDPWTLLGSLRSRYFPRNAILKLDEQNFLTGRGFLLETSAGETYFIMPYLGEGADKKSALDLK